ncbi:MAG: hypothetical protein J0H10_17065 [Alphaproteobacteria bacterium]|nr:hypothetical protein [Alphaproteobacteria bacterium]
MILRFLTRILIALGLRHSETCAGRIHRIETDFGMMEVCTECQHRYLIDRNAGEG